MPIIRCATNGIRTNLSLIMVWFEDKSRKAGIRLPMKGSDQ